MTVMMKLFPLEEALETCLIKSLEKDDINAILNELPDSKYKSAVKKIKASM